MLSSGDLLLIGGPVYSGRLPGIFADFDKCLHCHRCVYSCPVKAKVIDQVMVPIVSWMVANCTQKRLEPRFFLE